MPEKPPSLNRFESGKEKYVPGGQLSGHFDSSEVLDDIDVDVFIDEFDDEDDDDDEDSDEQSYVSMEDGRV